MDDAHLIISAGIQVLRHRKSVEGGRRLAEDPPSASLVWDKFLKPLKYGFAADALLGHLVDNVSLATENDADCR